VSKASSRTILMWYSLGGTPCPLVSSVVVLPLAICTRRAIVLSHGGRPIRHRRTGHLRGMCTMRVCRQDDDEACAQENQRIRIQGSGVVGAYRWIHSERFRDAETYVAPRCAGGGRFVRERRSSGTDG